MRNKIFLYFEMKSILICLFSLSIFFISSCSQNPNTITIKGIIANLVSDEIVFNFPDTSYEATVDPNGNLQKELIGPQTQESLEEIIKALEQNL